MKDLLSSPLFGILISLLAFEIGCFIYKKTNFPIFNPLLISLLLIIVFLLKAKISFEDFNKGGQYITFFLGPSTIVLAVPLYKKIKLLKSNLVPIIVGIVAGSITSILSVLILAYLFKLPEDLAKSLIPKSVTTPIGIEISKQLGAIPSITVIAIIITGIMGAIVSPFICNTFKIHDKVAKGIAIGTSSHALGTTKAIELGEVEGAMSGLSIGVAGLVTVFLSPVLYALFTKSMHFLHLAR